LLFFLVCGPIATGGKKTEPTPLSLCRPSYFTMAHKTEKSLISFEDEGVPTTTLNKQQAAAAHAAAVTRNYSLQPRLGTHAGLALKGGRVLMVANKQTTERSRV